MGETGIDAGRTRIDVAGVRGVADEFDASADKLQDALNQLQGLSFAGASAGNWHVSKGDQISAGLHSLVSGLAEWKRANSEIAAQLRATAQRYDDAEARNAARTAAVYG